MTFALILVVATATAADARTIRLDKDGLTAWVPDGWKVDTTEAGISAAAPNQGATALFTTQPIRDLDLAYKNIGSVVKSLLPAAQFGQPRRVTVANLAAIAVNAVADVATQQGAAKIEVNALVLITPGQRALYVLTMVQAENAAAFDDPIRRILGGLAQAGAGGGAQPQAPKENPCWELKSQPNGWSRRAWNGLSFLLPPGWSVTEGKDPSTNEGYLQIAHSDGSSILIAGFAAARPDTAWQQIASQLAPYGLGDVAWGEVVGQRALCARGAASDGVLFHKGNKALVMLGRAGGDPAGMRGILGSMRWP